MAKEFECGNCNHPSSEKAWRYTTGLYLMSSPYVEKNIGRIDKEFVCPNCYEVVDGLRIQEKVE